MYKFSKVLTVPVQKKYRGTIVLGTAHLCLILLDVRKALDTINHEILMTKLNHYGIRENALIYCKAICPIDSNMFT